MKQLIFIFFVMLIGLSSPVMADDFSGHYSASATVSVSGLAGPFIITKQASFDTFFVDEQGSVHASVITRDNLLVPITGSVTDDGGITLSVDYQHQTCNVTGEIFADPDNSDADNSDADNAHFTIVGGGDCKTDGLSLEYTAFTAELIKHN